MTDQSKELALCLINENSEDFPYKARLTIAKREAPDSASAHISVMEWAKLLYNYAMWCQAQYDEEDKVFSSVDVLLAAAEVSEYYANHIITAP